MSDLPFDPAIERLRALATQSGATLVSDGPVHPDHVLLGLCADAHDLRAAEQAEWRRARELPHPTMANPAYAAVMAERDKFQLRRKAVLTRIGKIKSQTAAGVYAKAVLVNDRYCTAHQLAVSLTRDLMTLPGLRSSLWPAQEDA